MAKSPTSELLGRNPDIEGAGARCVGILDAELYERKLIKRNSRVAGRARDRIKRGTKGERTPCRSVNSDFDGERAIRSTRPDGLNPDIILILDVNWEAR